MPKHTDFNPELSQWRKAIGTNQKLEDQTDAEKINIFFETSGDVFETPDDVFGNLSSIQPKFKRSWTTTLFLMTIFFSTLAAASKSPSQTKGGEKFSDNDNGEVTKPTDYTQGSRPDYTYYSLNSEPLMKAYVENKDLLRLVNQVNIDYDPNDYRNSGMTRKIYEKRCSEMTQLVRINLAYAINSKVLSKIINARPTLSIHLTISTSEVGISGRYDSSKNLIILDSGNHFSDSKIRNVLSNELHHAGVATQNKDLDVNVADNLIPPKVDELKQTIKKGNKLIKEYEKLFELKKFDSPELIKLAEIIQDYEPMFFPVEIKLEDYQELLKQEGVKKIADNQFFINSDTTKFQGEAGEILNKNAWYLTARPINQNIMGCQINFLKDDIAQSKMAAFFLDWKYRKETYQNSAYTDPSFFFNKSDAHKTAEHVSDIERLPEKLKKLFFPEFCKIFSEFQKIEDYCNRPTIR